MEFTLHETLSEHELNSVIAATEGDDTQHRAAMARNAGIRALAEVRLIALQLAEAERE